MAFRIEITDTAWQEMAAAYDWVFQQAPASAHTWHRDLLEAISTLRHMPERCPLAPESREFNVEIRHLLHGRRRGVYRILFTIHADIVCILHVRHAARRTLTPDDEQPPGE